MVRSPVQDVEGVRVPKGKGTVPAISSATIEARIYREAAERVIDAVLGFRVEVGTLYRVERNEDGRFEQVAHSGRKATPEERVMYESLMYHAAHCVGQIPPGSRTL